VHGPGDRSGFRFSLVGVCIPAQPCTLVQRGRERERQRQREREGERDAGVSEVIPVKAPTILVGADPAEAPGYAAREFLSIKPPWSVYLDT
jgi:hypothetical protein